MRVVFMGTPSYAIPVMKELISLGCQLRAVYAQPDRPKGRGLTLEAPPVKSFAQGQKLPVFQPQSLRSPEVAAQLAHLEPEVVVVAAYGKILPLEMLTIPSQGCLNVHPSLLPKYRGPAPVASAILEGVSRTGVTLMLMDEGADTGPILAQTEVNIGPDDTTASLTPQLFEEGARLLRESLLPWVRGEIKASPQNHSQATFTTKIDKADGEARWDQPALVLERQLRAFTPWPGLYTRWRGRLLRVLEARALDRSVSEGAGLVVSLEEDDMPVGVVTSRGVLGLKSLQLEGKRGVRSSEFLQGYRDFVGSRLPS